MGIKPPGVEDSWDNCHVLAQANLIGYSHIRDYEHIEEQDMMYKFLAAGKGV